LRRLRKKLKESGCTDRAYTRLAALVADGLVGTVTHVTAMGVGDLINHGAYTTAGIC